MPALSAVAVVINLAVALIAAYWLVFRAPIGPQGEGRRVVVALALGAAALLVWMLLGLFPSLNPPRGGGMPPGALVAAVVPYLVRGALWAAAMWPLAMLLLERRLGVRLDAAASLCTQAWAPTVIIFVIVDALALFAGAALGG